MGGVIAKGNQANLITSINLLTGETQGFLNRREPLLISHGATGIHYNLHVDCFASILPLFPERLSCL